MAIKNPHIKHKIVSNLYRCDNPEKEFYCCNFAVTPTESKSVYNWDKVTCKNCLRHKPKGGY